MGKNFQGFRIGVLLLAMVSLLSAEESGSDELSFTIQSGDNRNLIWGVKFPEGEEKELSEAETKRLLEETVFPRVLADAAAKKEPEVWQIGFFHLDGLGTKRDLDRAEAAFRSGLALGQPEGMFYLGEYFQELGIREDDDPAAKEAYFLRAETLVREMLDAGFQGAARSAIPLASAFLYGWYGLEEDFERADSLLIAVENCVPESALCQFWRAKVFIKQKRFSEAFEYAEKSQNGFQAAADQSEEISAKMKEARAVKVAAAILGGEISKIDSEEFLEISKESIGLTGKTAWLVPLVLLAILGVLYWRTRRSWEKEGRGPNLRLSILWVSAAVLAAGIGFSIRLPGLNNGVGHWIGAILVTLTCVLTLTTVGWGRYFGSGPLFTGAGPIFKALAVVVGGIVGMQLVAMGYGELYELVLGKPLDRQLVSLFLKSETLLQLLGTVLIVGIAIPFYEEVFFRGFLYDALENRWSAKVALIVSSIFFALVHGLTFFVPLLFLSFILGALKMKQGNLRMCFLLHAANNSFSVLVGYFTSGGS